MSKESDFLIKNALLASKIAKKIDGELSVHGISFTEFLIMHHLYSSSLKTMRRIELAESVGISASGVTRLIAPMQKNRIVQKELNPRDARQSLVKLTETGARLYIEALESFQHRALKILEPLTSNQLEQLALLSEKLT